MSLYLFPLVALCSTRSLCGTTISTDSLPAQYLAASGTAFIPNKGQLKDTDGKVRPDLLYKANLSGMDVYLRQGGGLSYVLSHYTSTDSAGHDSPEETQTQPTASINNLTLPIAEGTSLPHKPDSVYLQRIDMDFIGSRSQPTATALNKAPGKMNYYYGSRHITGLGRYHRVEYANIYPNIDLLYQADKTGGLKYDLIIHPGGDPKKIQQAWQGVEAMYIGSEGELIMTTTMGELYEKIPKAYQLIAGEEKEIRAEYRIEEQQAELYTVSISLGDYDKNHELIIDPWVTYLGGSGDDKISTLSIDDSDNVVVEGWTLSSNFPTTVGAFQGTSGGGSRDAFVSHFSPTGTLNWSTYLGGSGVDQINTLSIDGSDNIVVGGQTGSSNFPTAGAFQGTFGGGQDAFVSHFSPSGTLNWSTYLGGSGNDFFITLSIDGNDNVVVGGVTGSSNFPTVGAFQGILGGGSDAFVSHFSPMGTLNWSTYLGGSGVDVILALSIDGSDNIVLGGNTGSSNFPTVGAFQGTSGGGTWDAFVSQFSPTGTLNWSTYLGGSGNDFFITLSLDGSDNIVLGGRTTSPNFPPSGAFQNTLGGGQDAFVSHFSPTGTLNWSTYLGGSGVDLITALSIDGSDNIVVGGLTTSANFPTAGAFQGTSGGGQDVFVSHFSPSGTMNWSTYLGGSGSDFIIALSIDGNDNVVLGGTTFSANFPTAGAFQGTFGGGAWDAFVSHFSPTGTLNWSTYLGGSSFDELSSGGIVMDTAGNINVGGDTYSTDFPTTSCAFQQTNAGSEDQYLTRFNRNGQVLCSSYIGGPGPGHDEMENPISLNSKGMIVMFGFVFSSGYPVTPGAYQTTFGGATDGFIGVFCPTTCGNFVLNMDFAATDTAICPGTAINFTDTTPICDTTGVTWQWQFPGAVPAQSTNQNPKGITYTSPGIYDVSLIISTPCGNDTLVKSNYIEVQSLSVVSLGGDTTLCLVAVDSLLLDPSIPGATYQWQNGSTDSLFYADTTGTYYVAVTDSNGCTASDTIEVTFVPALATTFATDTGICSGDSLLLWANGQGGTVQYSWSPTIGLSNPNIASPVAKPSTTTTYQVIVSNQCEADTGNITLTVNPLPVFTAQPDNATITKGDSILVNLFPDSLSYTWLPATGLSDASSSKPLVFPDQTTTYTVTATDSNGCKTTGTVLIIVEDQQFIIWLPNAFSPNGDGSNDLFTVRPIPVSDEGFIHFTVRIYDRWGEKIFEQSGDPKAAVTVSWDGKDKAGRLLSTGVYVWYIQGTKSNGNVEEIAKGNVTLLR